jgi:hypothetical protein
MAFEMRAIEKSLLEKNLNDFVDAWVQTKGHNAKFYSKTLSFLKKTLNEEENFE